MISFELEVVSTKIDRFGWSQMATAMKDRLTLDWCDVLSPFRLEEVKQACAFIMADRPKHATNEQQVRAEILSARSKVLAQLPQPQDPEPERVKMTPERRAEILTEFGREDDAAQARKFTDKPEERE